MNAPPGIDDVCNMAQALARNCDYAVFPCKLVIRPDGKADKLPARPEREGGHGFHDATKDPEQIAWLWQHWPGTLIAVRTGPASGVDVLDIDPRHPEAYLWWQDNERRLPPTRTYRTYSRGLHLYFRSRQGVTNTQGKLALGIDTRGDGGYIIHWFSYGLECIDQAPPAPWPDWLYHALTYRPPAPPPSARRASNPDAAIDGVLRKLSETREGNRNGMLFWAARKLGEHGLRHAEIEATLLPIAYAIGLTREHEIRQSRATIRSAMGRAAA